MHEVAGVGVEVTVETLELQPEHPADDVQAALVRIVVVPAADRAGLRRDPPGPEPRQLEGALAEHSGRRIRLLELVEADDTDGCGPRITHQVSVPRPAAPVPPGA